MSNYFTKNSLKPALISLSIGAIPFLATAAAPTAGKLIDSITNVLLSFVPILLGLAVLVFFWGLVKFINHADDEKALEEGKQLMIWGMIAVFIMVALWGIIGWIQQNLGLNVSTSLGTLPAMPDNVPSAP